MEIIYHLGEEGFFICSLDSFPNRWHISVDGEGGDDRVIS